MAKAEESSHYGGMSQTPADLLPNPSVSNSVVWTLSPDGRYSVKPACEAYMQSYTFKPWHSLVWLGQYVTRWGFIVWLAKLGRLSTTDRIESWGLTVDPLCELCMDWDETHTHLLFECQFSS